MNGRFSEGIEPATAKQVAYIESLLATAPEMPIGEMAELIQKCQADHNADHLLDGLDYDADKYARFCEAVREWFAEFTTSGITKSGASAAIDILRDGGMMARGMMYLYAKSSGRKLYPPMNKLHGGMYDLLCEME